MKIKLLSFAFMMLTVFGMQSQDTIAEPSTAVALSLSKDDCPGPGLRPSSTSSEQPDPVGAQLEIVKANPDTLDTRPVNFPFWMVKAIALDLEEKQRLEKEAQLFALEVETYQQLLESMEKKEQELQLQMTLLGKNISLLETRLKAEKVTKGAGTVIWSLRLLAALGVGFVLGRM